MSTTSSTHSSKMQDIIQKHCIRKKTDREHYTVAENITTNFQKKSFE